MPDQALSDVKVLDLTHYLAGPYCTKLLADFGADVLKIERPDGGDPVRRLGPFPNDIPHPEKSGLFLHLNTNKRSITLNLKTATGVGILKELVKDVDIVVESFRPGVMEDLGMGYDVLSSVNPTLVLIRISNFGQTGPYRDYKATEIVMYGMGGSMYSTGQADRYPLKLAETVTLFQGGHVAAVAAMMAFYGARYKGVGQQVDVSLFETAAGSIDRRVPQLLAYQYSGEITKRESRAAGGYPSGTYPCSDGYIVLAGGRQYFPRLAGMLGMPELVERYGTTEAQTNPYLKEEFEATVFYPWILGRTKEEAMEAAQKARVFCGAINTPEDLINSRHSSERGYFVEIEHPVAGKFKYPGAPFKMSKSPWHIRRPAPRLAQHNEEVYCGQLSYTKVELVRLREAGIV